MGEVITDVGIDLDGVLYPFSNAFRLYCEERLGVLNLPEPTHWNFYEDWGLDEETFTAWLTDAARTSQVFSTHLPYHGVTEAWKDLRSMGVRIHVLTARPQAAWEQTASWLTQYNLRVDTLHFGPSKAFLANLAKGKSILLDDHIFYYEEAEQAGIIPCLMNREWNESKKDANRVNNLAEFVSFIKGYNAHKEKTVVDIYNLKPTKKYKPYKNDSWDEPRHKQNPHRNDQTTSTYGDIWNTVPPEQNF